MAYNMVVSEIVSRPITSAFSVKELSYVVEQYIKEKKNVNVTINIKKNFDNIPSVFRTQMYGQQVNKLLAAFDVAANHFRKN